MSHEPFESRTFSRWMARCAMLAPMAAMLLWVGVWQVLNKYPQHTQEQAEPFSFALGTAVLAGGCVAGVVGLISGRRRGSRDTVYIALLGLVLSGGALLLALLGLGLKMMS